MANWQKALLAGDRLAKKFCDQLNKSAQEGLDAIPHVDYLGAKESGNGEGVVRLDVLITALHLVSARVVLRVIPNQFKEKLNRIKESLAEGVAKMVLAKSLKKLPSAGEFITFAGTVFDTVKFAAINAALEKSIREQSYAARNEMLTSNLNRGDFAMRKTEDVITRKITPRKKRKPNKNSGCKSH